MRRLVVALTLAVLAVPGQAAASTIQTGGGTLTFTATAGRVNVIEFRNGPNVVVRRVAGDNDPITSVPASCVVLVSGREYVCQNVVRIVVDVSSGNDVVDASELASSVSIVVQGGEGADELDGGAGADRLEGGPGADELDGGPGDDTLAGGDGNDDLFGNDGFDMLYGEAGDDALDGGRGPDAFGGGSGIDTASFGSGRASVSVTFDGAPNDGAPAENDNVLSDVEDVVANAEGTGTVAITGSAANNLLIVESGVGVITGGAGADTMYGGPLDDIVDARDGYADRVFCGAGSDTALVDPLDTVSESCESAPVTVVAGGADDRPPTVGWSAPANAARFRGNVVTTLAVDATDDRGVAKVQFFDDDRLLCEDTVAPYTCAYQARGSDVGRNTLIATAIDGADQATSAVRPVVVNRFRPSSLSLRLSPRRDRRAPYSFHARGRLAGAGTCAGRVTITAKAGRRTVSSRRARLARSCDYALTVRFRTRPARRLRFTARFHGNSTTLTRTSRVRIARLG
ncbi:MAG TPA: Ig-like domain-containing protein [Solirubrobacter sp.]|nr:Ig-like domain-containing protein [Solirubrobacter sp.]